MTPDESDSYWTAVDHLREQLKASEAARAEQAETIDKLRAERDDAAMARKNIGTETGGGKP